MQKLCIEKNSRIPIELSTIGYMCKEFQSIYCDYDGGIAHSEHTVLYSSKDFPQFWRELRNLSTLKFLCL